MSGGSQDGPRITTQRPLRPPSRGDVLVAVSLGADGCAVGVWATETDAAALVGRQPSLPSEASFPTVRVDPPVTIRVSVQEQGGRVRAVTTVDDFASAHPLVGVLPDGDLVLVGSRCWWSREGVVPNAGIYAPDGRLLASAVVGDGVGNVEVTSRGEIWVGYVDEGIFGNFGWNRPGPPPVGAPGLLCFSRSFDLVWRYPEDAREPIDDRPSLNVDGDTVWLTYDSAYPVARIANGELTVWDNPTGPAWAVLVDGPDIVLVGMRATLGTIADGAFRPTASCDLQLPPRPRGWVARGATLHVFGPQGEWLTTDVAALRAASG